MVVSVKIRGEKQLEKNMRSEFKKITGDVRKGLHAAGIFIKGEAIENTPKEHGVLRGSAFFNTDKGLAGGDPRLRVGFTAKYAPYVHEMPSSNKFTTPDTGPKFLQNAVFQNTKKIIEIIKKRAER